jgi:Fur family transcriptional regulator, zinc uptake regulator
MLTNPGRHIAQGLSAMPKHSAPTKSSAQRPQLRQSAVFEIHDHSHCVSDALAKAESRCEQNAAQLTPLRRQVLELILNVHKPVGAYDLLEQLAQRTQKRVAPPTVYRALEFLVEMGLVHRIASLNAYLACNNGDTHGEAVFFICRSCRNALEINSEAISAAISDTAKKARFIAEQRTVEVLGTCPQCAAAKISQ